MQLPQSPQVRINEAQRYTICMAISIPNSVAAVAVFRTGARGARLVPSIPEGPQNLFNVHRSAKGKVKLQVWVEGGASKQLCACGLILSKSATEWQFSVFSG
ncbi:hypothetical protein AVEN_221105-1 [Araneus ventricosus]|uniref:Uncharacterized protein n=1 Tax=Araneus ventricosus TaxID=182803 RepID=A0A4Y2P7V0_ARAVE|nr:hypothetical protein AVEN_221105-1 [Araneus ventricosus]